MSDAATDLARYYASFDARVREIVAYGAAHSPALAARLEAAGLEPDAIRTSADLVRLPPLRKERLPEIHASGPALGGMLAVPPRALRRLFQSPGPIYEPEPDEPDPWRWAPALRAAGLGPDDIVLNAFSYHLTPAGAMFEEGARALGCTVVPGGVGNQPQQVGAMAALGVTAFVGLPSYLKSLLETAREGGHELALRTALVTAEPLPPSLRALLQDEYGLRVYQLYGTAECGNLGFEGPSQQGWHLPDDALVEICDLTTGERLAPGESGEVVATLFRRDYILVRLAVGDLSAVMDAPLDPAVTTPRLVGWLGRSAESVKVRGLFVHPQQALQALSGVEGIERSRVVIEREGHRDRLRCLLLPAADADPGTLAERAAAALQGALKLRCEVEIVDALDPESPRFEDTRDWQ